MIWIDTDSYRILGQKYGLLSKNCCMSGFRYMPTTLFKDIRQLQVSSFPFYVRIWDRNGLVYIILLNDHVFMCMMITEIEIQT